MRINVYSQELTDETILFSKTSNTGLEYCAVQIVLHSSAKLHHPPDDDDRSAVTFWLPKSEKRRETLAKTFEKMAELVRKAPKASGLDRWTRQAHQKNWKECQQRCAVPARCFILRPRRSACTRLSNSLA